MKSNAPFFIGLASLVLTASLVLNTINSPGHVSLFLWMTTCIILSGIFFFAYLVNGLRAWRWLFPACIFTALSEIIFALTFNAINDLWAWVFGFAGIFIPTLAVYFTQPRRSTFIMQQAQSETS